MNTDDGSCKDYNSYESSYLKIREDGKNIKNVPNGFLSKKLCIEAFLSGADIKNIPPNFLDEDFFYDVLYVNYKLVDKVPEIYLTPRLLKLVAKDMLTEKQILASYFVEENEKDKYTPEQLSDAIIFDPTNIVYLKEKHPKRTQVLEIIAINNPDILDKLETIPFFIGVKSVSSGKITKKSLLEKLLSQHKSLSFFEKDSCILQ